MRFSRWSGRADEKLMRMVQAGESEALTELYRRYHYKLLRYFHRMLWKDALRAQDFLHDLFVKVIENQDSFDPDRKFSTWLYAAAFNMCKNEYRRQAHRDVVNGRLTGESMMEAVQPDLDHGDFKRKLEELLQGSEAGERNLWVLRYELDLPLAEIAVLLSCPEGTVKSRLFNLKRKLANQLQVYNPALKLSI